MIEMLGVLAIVGVLSVAGIAGYSKAMAKYKNNKAMDQISTIAANIKTIFASTGTYGGLSPSSAAEGKKNERAFNLGVFPDDMTKTCGATFADTCVKNGLNGGVEVAAADSNLTFTIKFTGLTKDACVAIATSDWGGAAGFKGVETASNTFTMSPTLAQVATGTTAVCKEEGASNVVTLKFY
jgi:Tfp pilus assembly protein PilE